jgi:hypothetical protein
MKSRTVAFQSQFRDKPIKFTRGSSERLVNPSEIIEPKPQRDRNPIVLPLLTKAIRQPGEPSHSHSHAEILPLHNRRTNPLGVYRVGPPHFPSPILQIARKTPILSQHMTRALKPSLVFCLIFAVAPCLSAAPNIASVSNAATAGIKWRDSTKTGLIELQRYRPWGGP